MIPPVINGDGMTFNNESIALGSGAVRLAGGATTGAGLGTDDGAAAMTGAADFGASGVRDVAGN